MSCPNPPFDVAYIKKFLEAIKSSSGDDEKAHALEDDLYIRTLEEIAWGATNPIELAKEALKSQTIKFSRWTA